MPGEGGATDLAARRRPWLRFGRLVVLLIAVVACGWYILEIREFKALNRIEAFVQQHTKITRAQANAADATLDDAQFLNPNQAVPSTRAVVATKVGDRRRAVAIAEAVARREPLNFGSWEFVAYLFQDTGSPTLRLAEARIRMLVPPVAPPP